jgi:hypothetical protein
VKCLVALSIVRDSARFWCIFIARATGVALASTIGSPEPINIIGGPGKDNIHAGDRNDCIVGGGGARQIFGAGGNDVYIGADDNKGKLHDREVIIP